MSQRTPFVLVLSSAIVLFSHSGFAQGTGNDRCVTLINNDARKVLDARAKADRRCIRNNQGGAAAACIDGTDAKTETKKTKLAAHFSSRCASNPPTFGTPAGGATAVNAAAEGAVNDLLHDLFGAGIAVGSGDQAGCQERVVQRAGQLAVTRWKEFRACKKSNLASFANAAALTAGCLGGPNGPQPDPTDKIAGRLAKLDATVQGRCIGKAITPVGAAFPGTCTGVTDAQFSSCVAERVACRFCESARDADGLPSAALNCDLFDNGAIDGTCGPLPTPTITPTVTTTPTNPPTPTIPAICQADVPITPIARAPFTLTAGSPFCGGTALSPPATAPFSGSVEDGAAMSIADLGVGCLYTGAFQGIRLPSGSTSILDVTGVQLLPPAVTLGGGPGNGQNDCTLGAGPDRHCLNGATGTDGMGACFSDVDCGGDGGTCNLDANCFFGPPIPVVASGVGTCIVNAFLTDLCGQVTLLPPAANLATALSARVYVTGGHPTPCPVCMGGVCSYGKRDGEACTPLGSENTSLDCLPDDVNFMTALTVPIASLTTGTTMLSDPAGFFCPGQLAAGAFGLSAARTVSETGVPPGGGTNALAMTLGATFCVPASGNALVDFLAQLPAAGAVSAAGQLDVSQVLP